MSGIHDLVRLHGRDEARKLVSPEDRHLVDMASAVMSVENPAMGITYAGFCLTALPHRRLPSETDRWERVGHNVTLVIDPGSLPDASGVTRVHGVPYGSRARMILLYLQTRAIQTQSPEVELGGSMRDWLQRMGIPIGGKSFKDVKEQANRISACNLTFVWKNEFGGTRFAKDSIVKGGIQLYEGDDNQPRLWVDTVRLSDHFYRALCDHPVPISEPALRQIANDSPAIDVYIWLAYRLHALDRQTSVSWAALHQQFGAGYAQVRQFRARFLPTLQEALAVYPDARVDVDKDGIILHPSRPPVPEKVLRIA